MSMKVKLCKATLEAGVCERVYVEVTGDSASDVAGNVSDVCNFGGQSLFPDEHNMLESYLTNHGDDGLLDPGVFNFKFYDRELRHGWITISVQIVEG